MKFILYTRRPKRSGANMGRGEPGGLTSIFTPNQKGEGNILTN